MTKTQAKMLDAMRAAIASGEWVAVSGQTIRYTETLETPEGIPDRWWPGATYDRYVFVTLTLGGMILGVARAPWVERTDQSVTYKRAFAVLADPASVFAS